MNDQSLEVLGRILERIAPIPPAVLVIGSFGLALLERRLEAESRPIRTRDIDIAADLTAQGGRRCLEWLEELPDRLRGLYRIAFGGDVPGAVPFTFLEPERPELPSIELLVRLSGGGARPPEYRGRLRPMRPRNLELLFVHPWASTTEQGLEVMTPNPLCFALQKARIRRDRKGDQDAGSVLRIAEASLSRPEAVRGLLHAVEAEIGRHRKHLSAALRDFDADFLDEDAVRPTRALLALDRPTSPGSQAGARRALRQFLELCSEALQ